MLLIPHKHALKLKIDNYLWTCVQKPKVDACLQMTTTGLKVSFTVQETKPKITAFEQQEPMLMVCQDSAVEVFLAFADKAHDVTFEPKLEHCMYTNIEINAQGVCYAKYGRSRKNRVAYSKEDIASLNIQCQQHEAYWSCCLEIPHTLVTKLAGFDAFSDNNVFFINLYKISESKEIEHYIALNLIDNPTPNFHLPEFFAKAVSAPSA